MQFGCLSSRMVHKYASRNNIYVYGYDCHNWTVSYISSSMDLEHYDTKHHNLQHKIRLMLCSTNKQKQQKKYTIARDKIQKETHLDQHTQR